MSTPTCRSRSIRIQPRWLDMSRLDAKLITRFEDVLEDHPVGGRVVFTKEKGWSTASLRVRRIVGSDISDFDTAITQANAAGGTLELPADEIAGIDGIVIDASAVEAGAIVSVSIRLDYPVADEQPLPSVAFG